MSSWGQSVPKAIRAMQIDPDGSVWVPLSQGKRARIDPTDADFVGQWNWCVAVRGYVVRKQGKKILMLHRELLGAPADVEVDHISGDRLDNRQSNLRFASVSQNRKNTKKNTRNKSGHKGVCWDKSRGKWLVTCQQRHVGRFSQLEEAIEAYEGRAKEAFGEFKRPLELY
jgi:hypothetical protein